MKRVFLRIKKHFYKKQFAQFSIHSAIGSDGCGRGCRIVGAKRISLSSQTYIAEGAELIALNEHAGKALTSEIKIGENTRIHERARITSARSIIIGKNVLIAPDVFITDHNHGMNPEVPEGFAKQELIIKPVKIGDGTWIGERVCILPGVSIGRHCIIGAGSVCSRSIPDYSIAVGIPAYVIKQWNKKEKKWDQYK